MKKFLAILASVGFVILLIWISATVTALAIASSEEYYKTNLRECGVYSEENEDGTERRRIIYFVGGSRAVKATLSDEQLDAVAEHVVGYLFGDVKDFELVLDGVEIIGGGIQDGVSLFGEKAITHMEDVKGLIRGIQISLIPSAVLMLLLLVYILKKQKPRDVIKYTLAFLFIILCAAALFCLWSYLGSSENNPFLLNLWGNLHYIIFAFQGDAYRGSFLADALVYILTLDFFIGAVLLVAAVIAAVLAIWLVALFIPERYSKKYNR